MLEEGLVPAPATSASGLGLDGLRMLRAIDGLPRDEREVFDLVRIQGLTEANAAQLLGVSAVTVKRRLSGGLRFLAEQLADLRRVRNRPTRSKSTLVRGKATRRDGVGWVRPEAATRRRNRRRNTLCYCALQN